jgi:hypothetical protein
MRRPRCAAAPVGLRNLEKGKKDPVKKSATTDPETSALWNDRVLRYDVAVARGGLLDWKTYGIAHTGSWRNNDRAG